MDEGAPSRAPAAAARCCDVAAARKLPHAAAHVAARRSTRSERMRAVYFLLSVARERAFRNLTILVAQRGSEAAAACRKRPTHSSSQTDLGKTFWEIASEPFPLLQPAREPFSRRGDGKETAA